MTITKDQARVVLAAAAADVNDGYLDGLISREDWAVRLVEIKADMARYGGLSWDDLNSVSL